MTYKVEIIGDFYCVQIDRYTQTSTRITRRGTDRDQLASQVASHIKGAACLLFPDGVYVVGDYLPAPREN